MACLAAILAFGPAILEIAFNYTIRPTVRHIRYPFKCNSNVAKLSEKLEEMKNAQTRVHNRVDFEARNGAVVEKDVHEWIVKVQDSVDRLRVEIAGEEERIQNNCFFGLCPNIKALYQLSKHSEKETVNLDNLKRRRETFERLTYQPVLSTDSMSAKDYEEFDSRSNNFKRIMDALVSSSSEMIGVYGTGGVGKTMLVQEVVRQARIEKLFDEVVVARVNQIPDLKHIQAIIGESLGLKFIEESMETRASRLRERLKQKEKILIVLDNLWAELNLVEVGIPSTDDHKGCKIIMTSRDLNVLSNGMDCQNNFQIHALHEEEAWNLFKKRAGECFQNPELLSIAQKVSNKCGGLPLAISTVARALKNKSLSDWNDALRDLERPSPGNFIGRVPSKVYSALQLSYYHLSRDEHRATFLLCCQLSRLDVGDLLKYGLGLSLFPNILSIEEAKDRVQSLVDHLVAACLIREENGVISAHDFVRDVGISIASRDENVFVRDREFDLKKWYQEDSRRSYKAISLARCTQLPEKLGCQELGFFYLSSKYQHLEIPDHIFEGAVNLKVLDITRLCLPSLPYSLVQLQNLRTLCLDHSELRDLSIVGKLKNLEIFSIFGSKIESLPAEIGQLSKLKLLDLTGCYFLKMIPANVLSKLSNLEDLRMQNSFDQWGIFEGQNKASLMELKHLSYLTNLEIHIRDPKIIPTELFSEKLKRYKIYIGNDWDCDSVMTSKTLKLKLDTDIRDERYGVRILMKTVERLYLDEVEGVETVLYQLNSEGFPLLKHLHVQNHSKVKYLVAGVTNTNWVPCNNAFPVLESLVLNNLVSLKKFYKGKLCSQSFGRLKTLEVSRCPRLKYLFTSSVAKGLSQLQKITISGCINLEMIVAEESEAKDTTICFNQLCSLSLESLPRLKCFHSKVDDPLATEQIIAEDSQMTSHHTSLLNAKVTFPNLEYLRLSSIQVENIWDDQPGDFTTGTHKLTTLVVEDCENLRYLLSPSMITSLVQLQKLDICDCKSIEEIEMTSLFPGLHSLKLNGLPKLASFCIANLIELSSLKYLEIQGCPLMREFISSALDSDDINSTFFDRKVSVPKLEILQISNMDHLKRIWHNQFQPNSLCKLKILRITDAKELLCIFPSNSFLAQFCHLEELFISSCDSVEMVFDKQMVMYSQQSNSRAVSQLQSIVIENLPNLKYVWNWDETDDVQGIVSFHNLRIVNVEDCPSLEALFPASVAKDLPYLEELSLIKCKKLKEIVAREVEGVNKEVPLFKLHQLTYLCLVNLPNLSTFYPGMHISEWPALKKLELCLLPQINIFDRLEYIPLSVSQSFFPFAKILPNLEQLLLSSSDVRKLPAALYYQIKSLLLSFVDDESTVFPFDFLHKFPHLETLEVIYGNFKDLFPREEEDSGSYSLGGRIIQQLRHLNLIRVDGLNHIWHPDFQLDHLQNIETLSVWYCHNLIELAPSAASFQSLTFLDVHKCIGLQHILSPTTAKSLVQLDCMRVRDCDLLSEIVANEGDGLDDSIIFTKLATLELVGLPELSCFCSTKHSLKFPSLVQLVVEQCPKMMIFSRGYLSTPNLELVNLAKTNESSYRWDGNLNRTVEMLFKEKNTIQEVCESFDLFSNQKKPEIYAKSLL